MSDWFQRRRLQNRMAQRAYRQRKESAIDVLKQKVEELEKSKEAMSKEFLNFTTVILEQDNLKACPEIVERIKNSTISILTSVQELDDNGSPEDPVMDHILPPDEVPAEVSMNYPLAADQNSTMDISLMDYLSELEVDNSFGYTATEKPSTVPDYEYNTSIPDAFDSRCYMQRPTTQTPLCNMYQLPGANWDTSLCCPRSYASQEATFGRRYHRAAQEGGFLLASMKHAPPSWYKKVFGFCMHFETREEISSRLGEAVRKSQNSTLNNWRFPFTNIGGAGLFYPDQGFDDNESPIGNRFLQNEAYRPSEMSGFSMGPFGPSIEQVRDLRLNPQLRIIDPEYDGDFFDADEIEICLRGYGVTIPPNKDFVTAYIDMGMFQRAEVEEVAGFQPKDPVTPPDKSNESPTATGIERDQQSFGAVAATFRCPAGMMGMAMGSMPPPPKPQSQEYWKTPTRKETKVKIDVERLITGKLTTMLFRLLLIDSTKGLCSSTVCLGRTPAVRPKDIRMSLKMSLVDND